MADVTFEQSPPRQTRNERNPQRVLLVIIGILAVVLVGELIYHFVVSPWLRIERIVLDSELDIPEERILELAGLGQNPHYVSVDLSAIEQDIARIPAVRSVTVEKRFPNELAISITRREPLAISFADGGSTPVLFDAEGVIYEWKDDVRGLDLPIISGLRFENVSLGTSLPRYLGSFLADLDELQQQAPALFGQFSEYRIVSTGDRDFEVVLYPQSFGVPVRIEPRLDERTARYIIMILDAFRREGSLDTMRELDLRAGEVVFRMREEQ